MALTESELSAILEREQQQSIAYMSGDLAKEREDALLRYYGELYGNEEEGQSKVVMRDVQDVVEWLLPALLKIFMSGDQVVEYQPRGPEDEEAAKQRTEYINYVFQQDNNAFLILYTVFKDALIQKNGIVKVYYDKAAIDELRTVREIDDDAFALLTSDPDIEIIQHTEYADDVSAAVAGPAPQEQGGAVGPTPGPMNGAGPLSPSVDASQVAPAAPPTSHDVKYRKVKGKVCIENIPPEQWLISRRAVDIVTAPYVADRKRKTISELISEGLITKAEADSIPGGDDEDLTGEQTVRRTVPDNNGDDMLLSDRESPMREVWVTDHYIQVDFDEDGIAERRRIITVGTTSLIKLNEEWEGAPPYASGSPILVPHRVIGQSIADQVSDLQLINTTLMRQLLTNLYLSNHPRFAGSGVNLDDWYSPRLGQLVQTEGNPNDSIKEIGVQFTAGQTLPVMEYIATIRENRTGVTRYNQGIDANSLNKTATGISQIMNAAQQRTELIARILAETFMKPLFKLIDHCVTKYQDRERVIRIRNEWVTVDPTQWETNYDMTINVGLGTGNKDQMLMHLQMIAGMQAQTIQFQGGANGPLVTLDNVYSTMAKIVENAGLKNVDAFWTDPKKAALQPQPPPPPDPEMVKIQQQGEIDKAKLAQQAQNDQQKLALEKEKAQAEMMLKWQEMNANLSLKKETADQQSALARDKASSDADLKRTVEANKPQIIVGSEGKAAKVVDNTDAVAKAVDGMAQLLAAMVQQQAQRDAAQDAQLKAMMQLLTAPKEVIRGPDGRASGVRTVLNGSGTVQ